MIIRKSVQPWTGLLYLTLLLLLLFSIAAAQREFSSCYSSNGTPTRCEPGPETFTLDVEPTVVNSTCGDPPVQYCLRDSSGNIVSCSEVCNLGDHPPGLMTDFFPSTPKTWWQSESNLSQPVLIELSLSALVQIQAVRFVFTSLKPDAFYLQKSDNYGSSYSPYHFFATGCLQRYGIDPTAPITMSNETEVLCQTIGSNDRYPGQISFVPRLNRPSSNDSIPGLSEALYNFATATNIRVLLDGYSTLDSANVSDYYYALEDLSVVGKCQCHGHANVCLSDSNGVRRCGCQHNTTGDNCEQCADMYVDIPWRISNGGAPFECRACNCNNRSTSCIFDQALYDATGSGGRCLNCTHNSEGPHCELCTRRFYPDENLPVNSPNYCQSCDCNIAGVTDDGDCSRDNTTLGHCYCKPNVRGRTCDTCETGFFNLSLTNPSGCQDCGCHSNLSLTPACDVNGVCLCIPNAMGTKCTECISGYYLSAYNTCSPCNCDLGGALTKECDSSGQCTCRTGVTGQTCSEVSTGYFSLFLDYYLYEAEDGLGLFDLSYRSHSPSNLNTGAGYALVSDATDLINFGIFTPPISGSYDIVIRYSLNDSFVWSSALIRIDVGTEDGTGPPVSCPEYSGLDQYYNNWNFGVGQAVVLTLCLRGGRSYNFTLNGFQPGSPQSQLEVDSMVIMLNRGDNIRSLNNTSLTTQYDDCLDSIRKLSTRTQLTLDNCHNISFSVFTEIFNGTLVCDCHPEGSNNPSQCMEYGGQCMCKANVIGRSCDQCAAGFHSLSSSGCADCSCSVGSASSFCHRITGQCTCLPAVNGTRCDVCNDEYFNINSGTGCQECSCDRNGSVSLQCDQVTGVCQCHSGVTDAKCDRCLDLHYGFPDCRECGCSPDGSINSTCNIITGQCSCRGNTEGRTCDTCSAGTFNLQPTNPNGCQPCYCSGLTKQCSSASGYVSQSIYTDFTVSNSWSIDGAATLQSGIVIANATAYLIAPSQFLGNRLSSYGQFVRINLTIGGSVSSLVHSYDVSLESGSTQLFGVYRESLIPGEQQLLTVHLHESAGWTDGSGDPITAFTLQSVLFNLTGLSLRVSLSNESVTILSISLDSTATGTDPNGAVGWVEQCTCPSINYTGLSCESCSYGYARNISGACVQCQCNGLADACDEDTGVCFNCTGNAIGDNCQECASGFYGDPVQGIQCLPCPCPLVSYPGNYSSTCVLSAGANDGVLCTDCFEGHEGDHCQECGPGFYGDPTGEKSGNSTRCSSCTCNGNIDLEDWRSCDNVTGICLNCLFNTTGDQCQYCLNGYYGDPITAKNCTACQCDPIGSNGENCANPNGQCNCHSNVTGLKCDQCLPNHYNFSVLGCQSCDCHTNGSQSEQCNLITGNCPCKPGVTGQKCDVCQFGYYQLDSDGCKPCNCSNGALTEQCTQNGSCLCKDGVMGEKCDMCMENYFQNSSTGLCEGCPTCYSDLQSLVNEVRTHYRTTRERVNTIAQRNDPSTSFDDKRVYAERIVSDLHQRTLLLNASYSQTDLDEFYRAATSFASNVTEIQSSEQMLKRTSSTLNVFAQVTEELVNRTKMVLYESLSFIVNVNKTVLPDVQRRVDVILSNTEVGNMSRDQAVAHIAALQMELEDLELNASRAMTQAANSFTVAQSLLTLYSSTLNDLTSLENATWYLGERTAAVNASLNQLQFDISVERMALSEVANLINGLMIPSESLIQELTGTVNLLVQRDQSLSEDLARQQTLLGYIQSNLTDHRNELSETHYQLNQTIFSINQYYSQLNQKCSDALEASLASDACFSNGQMVLSSLESFNFTILALRIQTNIALGAVSTIRSETERAQEIVQNATTQLQETNLTLSKAKMLSNETLVESTALELVASELDVNSSLLLNQTQSLSNATLTALNETQSVIGAANITLTEIEKLETNVSAVTNLLQRSDVSHLASNAEILSANATLSVANLMSLLSSTPSPDTDLISAVEQYISSLTAQFNATDVSVMTQFFEARLGSLDAELSALQSELAVAETEATRLRTVLNSLPPDCS